MKSPDRHRHRADETVKHVGAGVITVSDTRTEGDDISGRIVREILKNGGAKVVRYALVKDDVSEIRVALQTMLSNEKVDVIVLNGGTGIAPRDVTPEAIEPYLDKRIEGFGELFRSLSFGEIGTASMLSRALAGVTRNGIVIFALPGSPDAVKLAMEKIIMPELRHLVSMTRTER